jgi:SAM-dependent methyltransferase
MTEPFKYSGEELEAMKFAKNYHRWIVSEFRDFIGKTCVEIGAGQGALTELLVKKTEKLYAVEPDAENARHLNQLAEKENGKIVVFNDYFNPSDIPEKVDSLVYVNVLEHIENDVEELKNALISLKDNGYVCVFVPAIEGLYGEVDRKVGHYRRYSKKRLRNIFEQDLKLEICKLKYFDFSGIIPWYISACLLKKTSINVSAIKLYDRLVIPIIKPIETIVPPPIGKNLLLVARKKSTI